MSQKKKALLSKSTFIKGLQCRKALYLYKNRYFLRDPLSPEQRAKFVRGTNVGIFARQLYPGGVDASPKTHFQMAKSVEKTRGLIEAGQTDVIYEAAFSYDDVVVALDILYKENNNWKAIEVKSSKAISETYHWDAALQYYVIKGSGLNLHDFKIAYIDKEFVKNDDIDPWKIFTLESRLDDVMIKHDEVGRLVAELKETIALKSSPDIPIGKHCNDPYPCEFIGHCWKKVPADSIFLLEGIDEGQKFDLYNDKGIKSIDHLPDLITNKPEFQNQIESIREKKPWIDKVKLATFFPSKEKKQIFLETFTFAPALPVFDGTRPYEMMPFGVGWMTTESDNPNYVIIEPGQFPSDSICDVLLDKTAEAEIVWVYNVRKEKALLDQYALNQPNKKQKLKKLKNTFRDLMQPLYENMIIFPSGQDLKKAEDILAHFGTDYEILPQNLVVPEEVDALYQKIFNNMMIEDQQTALAAIEEHIKVKVKNLQALYNLWQSFNF
ncbi:MAG: DUF2779 domain-containing protein [Bacteroidetes bacterium]|nr:MAG: DUF2779 domain-containing protein [Bacteroidota bacterium]